MQSGQNVEGVLSNLISVINGAGYALGYMMAAAGFGLFLYAAWRVWETVNSGEGNPLGWIIAAGFGALLTIALVIVGRISLFWVS